MHRFHPPPLVSVIIPTRNSAGFLPACLQSIREQTYANIEIIVVDNHSSDQTTTIARSGADQVFTCGPERSAQVNFGAQRATGEFIYRVDSDFVLAPTVVEECLQRITAGCDAVVVHNTPDERVSWVARVRKFEVDMYKYDLTHSAARFFKRDVFEALGGYNERLTAGEDYDIQNRLIRLGFKTDFVEAEAVHLGEPPRLGPHLMKYFEYGRDFVNFRRENQDDAGRQLRFLRPAYLRNWRRFAAHPARGAGFLVYNAAKFLFGAAGYLTAWIRRPSARRS